jgi:hypothetical protein
LIDVRNAPARCAFRRSSCTAGATRTAASRRAASWPSTSPARGHPVAQPAEQHRGGRTGAPRTAHPRRRCRSRTRSCRKGSRRTPRHPWRPHGEPALHERQLTANARRSALRRWHGDGASARTKRYEDWTPDSRSALEVCYRPSAARIWLSHSMPSWRPFGSWSPRSQRHVAIIASTRIRHSRSRSWSTPG